MVGNRPQYLIEHANQSILVFSFFVVILSFSMILTTAPQPEEASRSIAFIRACDMHSNNSSGVISGFHNVSHMPEIKSNSYPLRSNLENLFEPLALYHFIRIVKLTYQIIVLRKFPQHQNLVALSYSQ